MQLTLKNQVNDKIGETMKGVSLLRKLQCFLPRSSLLTICKPFTRLCLDYGDAIYPQPLNITLSSKTKSVQ